MGHKLVDDAAVRSILAEHQALLFRLARELGPADELDPVLRKVLKGMRSLVEFRGGTICLIDKDGVFVAAADPEVSASVAAARVPIGTGLAGRCITGGDAIYSPDITVDPRVDQRLASMGSNRDMRSYLAAPLVCLGEVIGLLQVDSTQVDAFDQDDIHLLSGLAAQVAGAIESARRFEQVRQLEEARSAVIVRVSHELRTPVTILGGLTKLLVDRPDLFHVGDDARVLLGRIDAAATRLQLLVEKLVSVTMLDADVTIVQEPGETPLLALLEDVRELSVRPSDVTVSCPAELTANVDDRHLHQVLEHLVDNALAYAGSAALRAEVVGGAVVVEVCDHGPGIADAEKVAVFERFRRGDHTRAGWGLGLHIVARLTEAMGLELELRDTPGGGTTIALTFPGS